MALRGSSGLSYALLWPSSLVRGVLVPGRADWTWHRLKRLEEFRVRSVVVDWLSLTVVAQHVGKMVVSLVIAFESKDFTGLRRTLLSQIRL